MITWVANDIGRSGDNGVMRYRGLTFLTQLTLPLPVAKNKSDKIICGVGKGVITAENGEMITWVANNIGRSGDNGVMRYRGLTILLQRHFFLYQWPKTGFP